MSEYKVRAAMIVVLVIAFVMAMAVLFAPVAAAPFTDAHGTHIGEDGEIAHDSDRRWCPSRQWQNSHYHAQNWMGVAQRWLVTWDGSIARVQKQLKVAGWSWYNVHDPYNCRLPFWWFEPDPATS